LSRIILDNHCHIDPRNGDGIDAVKRFDRSGGTHMCIVNKPSWVLGVEASEGDDFRGVFEETLETVERASEVIEGEAFAVLGVHPGLVSRLIERFGGSQDLKALERAEEVMKEGLGVASEYVKETEAIAVKSGRPHYEVDDEVWEASNRIMQRAFELGSEVGCAVQLHTEGPGETEGGDFSDIAQLAKGAGLSVDRVVKHYSSPTVSELRRSVLAHEEWVFEAAKDGREFMLETDYIDDPDRPGAVLGTRTVPKRAKALVEDGYEDAVRGACVETPERVYGIDISL